MRARVLGVLASTVLLAGATLTLTSGSASADEGVVEGIVDGDTFKVRLDGRVETVRLLNIDTPETKDPDKDVECLGPEASEALGVLLPVGSTVALEYDQERVDRYGRTLAAAFGADGTLVNAELARLGLGAAVVFGPNDKFLSAVRTAQDEAAAAERGLHSDEVACTVGGQVAAVGQGITAAQAPVIALSTMSSSELAPAVATAAAVAATASALADRFRAPSKGVVWSALSTGQLERLRATAQQHRIRAKQEKVRVEAAHATAVAREAEAARVAAEAEAARLAEVAAAAERDRVAAAEAQRRAAAAARPPRVSRPAAKPPAPASNPYPGYTGPRCYAPGGKTWRPC